MTDDPHYSQQEVENLFLNFQTDLTALERLVIMLGAIQITDGPSPGAMIEEFTAQADDLDRQHAFKPEHRRLADLMKMTATAAAKRLAGEGL